MEKKQKIKPVRWPSFPLTVHFLQRTGETTPLAEGLQAEVFASCYAKTQEALVFCLAVVKDVRVWMKDRTRRLISLKDCNAY